MAIHLDNDEAERLATQLAALTGETVSESVTRALRERLDRLRGADCPNPERIAAELARVAGEIREEFDLAPISKNEWDNLWGESELPAGS